MIFRILFGDTDEYIPAWHKIIDSQGYYWECEKEYAEEGEREGWLQLYSYKNMWGEMGNVYKHTP